MQIGRRYDQQGYPVDTVVGEPVTHQRAAFEAGRLDVV